MNETSNGYCALILHTHLPYVHHPDYEHFLEEEWLFEALAETYLPLLARFIELRDASIPFRISMSLTPPLLFMWKTASLRSKFATYLKNRESLARQVEKDPERFFHSEESDADSQIRKRCIEHYVERYRRLQALWKSIDGDLLSSFRQLQDDGNLEILASAATHGFLPLFQRKEAIAAQIRLGVELTEKCFGRRPRGFWLPECAWHEKLGAPLRAAGIEWLVLDHHGIVGADPRPKHDHYRPAEIAEGLFAFGRDPRCSEQVWSSKVGYPGDPAYRELYRDIGYDADYRAIRPYLNPDGIRRNVGLKFQRITADVELHEKKNYDPEAAEIRTRAHAANFLDSRRDQIADLRRTLDTRPVLTAPYDTELFGHWWYEGPSFLEQLFRQHQLRGDAAGFEFATPSEILDHRGPRSRVFAHPSTWGRNGYSEVWANEKNAWMWPHLFEMQKRMCQRAEEFSQRNPTWMERRFLNQMVRELLLAESSDWPFIVTMETSAHYAERRFRDHVHRFFALEDAFDGALFSEAELHSVELHDAVFPDLDFRIYAGA
ncbi:MAG: 1,4-alpha-glucan branching protein domain-containing protein [Planctomycetota bacterium]